MMTKTNAMLVAATAVALSSFYATPANAETSVAKASKPPALVAVMFHADWCKSCKAIQPSLAKLKKSQSQKSVLFVTLDLTDEATTEQSRMMAHLLGLSGAFRKHAPKTGYVLLIDPATKTVRAKLTKRDSHNDMRIKLKNALRAGGCDG